MKRKREQKTHTRSQTDTVPVRIERMIAKNWADVVNCKIVSSVLFRCSWPSSSSSSSTEYACFSLLFSFIILAKRRVCECVWVHAVSVMISDCHKEMMAYDMIISWYEMRATRHDHEEWETLCAISMDHKSRAQAQQLSAAYSVWRELSAQRRNTQRQTVHFSTSPS